ncbi:MAG: ABC transporter substrate-binding protein [Bacillota bacterium]
MRRRVPAISCLLLVIALLLIFRAGDGTEVPEPEAETAVVNSSNPVTGGSLDVGITGDLRTLDPHQAATAEERMAARALTDSLFRFDFSDGLQGELLTGWEVREDGLVYVLYLRPGLEFFDGTACDAEAVRDNLVRMRQVGSPVMAGSWLSSIKEIEVVDELEIHLVLWHPDPNLPFNLSRAETGLVSIPAAEQMEADFAQAPVGLGPFQVASIPGEQDDQGLQILPDVQAQGVDLVPVAHFVAFEDYWRGRAYIDSITLFEVTPGSDPAQMLSGGLDLIPEVPPGYEVPEELGYTFTRTNLDHHLIALNLSSSALTDVRVRMALDCAVDRRVIVEEVFGGDAQVLSIGDTPGAAYNGDVTEHAPARAKRLLDDAGYGESGIRLSLNMLSDDDPARVRASEILAGQIRAIGVDVQLEVVPREEYYDRMREGDYDISYWVLIPRLADCSAYTANLHSDSYWNVSHLWRNQDMSEVRVAVDELLQQAFESVDLQQRESLYRDFARLAADEQLYISLCSSEVRGAAIEGLRGMDVPYGFAFDFSRTWLRRR